MFKVVKNFALSKEKETHELERLLHLIAEIPIDAFNFLTDIYVNDHIYPLMGDEGEFTEQSLISKLYGSEKVSSDVGLKIMYSLDGLQRSGILEKNSNREFRLTLTGNGC